MIETTVLDYLNENLSVPCYMEVPERATGEFVVIEKTGSGCYNHIFSATLAIQSYADTLAKSAELNESAKTAMFNIIELDSISDISLNTDYNFTDTETKKYRYQAVFDITHY